jgi:hypothetical protein
VLLERAPRLWTAMAALLAVPGIARVFCFDRCADAIGWHVRSGCALPRCCAVRLAAGVFGRGIRHVC